MKELFIVAIMFVVLCFGIVLAVLTGGYQGQGNGEHTGYVTAVEEIGTIWKTKRIHFKTDLASSQEDVYCVMSQSVYDLAREASKSKSPVTLLYEDQGFVWTWDCGGESTTVVGVEPGT